MTRAYASTIVDQPVDAVWAMVRVFDAVGRWIPGAKSCVIVPAASHLAPVRRIVLADDVVVDEVLMTLDDLHRVIRYAFVAEPPRGMRAFLGTAHVRPVTDGDRTFLEWFSEFDCDAVREDAMVRNITATLTALVGAIRVEAETDGGRQ